MYLLPKSWRIRGISCEVFESARERDRNLQVFGGMRDMLQTSRYFSDARAKRRSNAMRQLTISLHLEVTFCGLLWQVACGVCCRVSCKRAGLWKKRDLAIQDCLQDSLWTLILAWVT